MSCSSGGSRSPLSASPGAASPRLSAICTVRNEVRHVAAALRSVLTPDVAELIVVDDGSTDGTNDVLRELAAADGRVRLLQSPVEGRGPALAAALASSSGEFIMNIDADDLVHPQWSQIGVGLLAEHPDVAAIAALPRYADAGDAIAWDDAAFAVRIRDVTTHLAFFNPVAHSSAIMRRSALDTVRGYDASRRTHFDYDLWIRLASRGWRVATSDARMVVKRVHAGQKFERAGRLAYLYASAVVQARAIAVVGGGAAAWGVLVGRLAWGLLPRALRMGIRRLSADGFRIRAADATGRLLERVYPPVGRP